MMFYQKLLLISFVIGLIECKVNWKNVNIDTETTSDAMENTHTWSYNSSTNGQDTWKSTYIHCGGENQSPINIISKNTIKNEFNKEDQLQIKGYGIRAQSFNLTNNGHTVTLDFNYVNEIIPYIFNGPLKQDTYQFYQIHFHWGKENMCGSEHSRDDKKNIMEIHLIHFNLKYKTFNEASIQHDGLAVIGLFYELNDCAPMYDFIEYFQYIQRSGTKLYITTNNNKPLYSLNDIIGKINFNEYFMYKGSLTTPPCYESVTWLVGVKTISIQPKQYSQFQALLNLDGNPMVNNYRNVQNINGRDVFNCFLE